MKVSRAKNAKIEVSQIVMDDCEELVPEKKIYLDELGISNFTSTGFTFDSADETFWVADHGTDGGDKLRLIELDKNLTKILSEVCVKDYINDGKMNLQGIAYDPVDNCIWMAVGDSIQEFSISNEKIVKIIDLGKYREYQANGICMDITDNTIWVLCYDEYMLHLDRNGNILDSYQINMKDQDMIYMHDDMIYITVGADYKDEENYCAVFDPQTGIFRIGYKLYQWLIVK